MNKYSDHQTLLHEAEIENSVKQIKSGHDIFLDSQVIMASVAIIYKYNKTGK